MTTLQSPQGRGRTAPPFGRLLKEWRGRRGFSQLDLATAARTTQRHLSFIESGRAEPSREMVLRLATTMDVPLRQQNALLLAAGYAPAWRERDLGGAELAPVNRALDYMLGQHEPFPAFVIDRVWNLLRANRGGLRLAQFLAASTAIPPEPQPEPEPDPEPVNLAVALMSPRGMRPWIVNWREVALYFVRGLQAEMQSDGGPHIVQLLSRLLQFPGVAEIAGALPAEDAAVPVVPVLFRRDAISLNLFTTIATLGTPRDVTLQEIRVECFFPVDEETEAIFRGWAAAE